jgi:hypothetical protein
MEESGTDHIEVEGVVRQEVVAIMAEAILAVAVVQTRKEEGDDHEYVEES